MAECQSLHLLTTAHRHRGQAYLAKGGLSASGVIL